MILVRDKKSKTTTVLVLKVLIWLEIETNIGITLSQI